MQLPLRLQGIVSRPQQLHYLPPVSPDSIRLPLESSTGYSFFSASTRTVYLDMTSGRS